MYCICSGRAFDQIVADQRANPLPFQGVLEKYTLCPSGCGSCIEPLRARLHEEQLLLEAGAISTEAGTYAVP